MSEPIDSWVFKNLYFLKYNTLDSTNNQALLLLKEGAIGGPSVIIALEQKKGRGQIQTKWHATPGLNLLTSLVLPKINLPLNQQFVFNMAVSLAVVHVLSKYCSGLKVKWPNDVYCGNKKLVGILIENQVQQSFIKSSVVGVGININETEFSHIPNATSLKLITGKSWDVAQIETQMAYAIYRNLTSLLTKPDEVLTAYHQKLFRINETHFFESNGTSFKGIVKGVNLNGQLRIEVDGLEGVFNFKEVAFVL